MERRRGSGGIRAAARAEPRGARRAAPHAGTPPPRGAASRVRTRHPAAAPGDVDDARSGPRGADRARAGSMRGTRRRPVGRVFQPPARPHVTAPAALGVAAHPRREPGATAFGVLACVSVSHLLNDTLQSVLPALYPMLKETFALSFS